MIIIINEWLLRRRRGMEEIDSNCTISSQDAEYNAGFVLHLKKQTNRYADLHCKKYRKSKKTQCGL